MAAVGLHPAGSHNLSPIAYLVLYGSVLFIFFIAIQRRRLYEIDIIIRRTLIYGTLTTVLAGVYFAVVLGMQMVARDLTGATGANQVVIVATTLLIAALFTPLRRAIQAGIDQAFYRSKYDAGQTLTTFAAWMRTVTDLDDVQAHMVDAVQQTLHPTRIAL